MYKTKSVTIPFIALVVIGVLLVANLFIFPHGCAVDEYRDALEMFEDEIVDDDLDMTAGDMTDLTMHEYYKINNAEREHDDDEEYTIRMVIMIVLAVAAVLVLVFALFKLGAGIIVFSIINAAAAALLSIDFSESDVLPSMMYDYGIGHYLGFILPALAFIGAIWLIVAKKKAKKAAKRNVID